MTSERRPEAGDGAARPAPLDVAPLDVDGVAAVAVGTISWAVALVVLLIMRSQLERSDSQWWIAVAATGCVLGILGLAYTTRRRATYRRARREP